MVSHLPPVVYVTTSGYLNRFVHPALSTLRLSPAERQYLEKNCPYFDSTYLEFLEKLQLDPASQVHVTFVPQSSMTQPVAEAEGERGPKRQKLDKVEQNGLEEQSEPAGPEEKGLIEMKIQGPWKECILYEVPLMSIRKSRDWQCLKQLHGWVVNASQHANGVA